MSMSLGYGSKRYMPEARHAIYDEGYGPPNYEQAVSSSGGTDTDSITTPRTADRPWSPTSPGFSASTAPTSQEHSRNNSGSTRRPLPHPQTQPLTVPRRNFERYVYRYRLAVGGSPVEFLISVEPESGRPIAGKYTFRLSFKANGVERPICEPVERTLTVGAQPHLALDPRHLEFIVFVFPGKTSLPAGCLWSVRVWLRVNGADHRLFGDDELWIGKDPDFNSIGDASFGRLKVQDATQQVYNAFVGRALVTFTFRWEKVTGNLYRYWLDYDAGGVGTNLFEDFRLKIDGDPRNVSFLVFTVPANSVPLGASHKLRVWLRSPTPLIRDPSANYALPFNDSYVYQRIWKTDDFKLGAQLNFDALGPKMLMAFTTGGPETVAMPSAPPKRQHGGRTNSLTFIEPVKGEDYGYANF